jgi:trk system potassium uptake protein TrkA
MKVIVLGAGHVGRAVVDALYEQHDLTVIDVDARRLAEFADRYDVRTVQGDGTTRKVVRKAGVEEADLLIACSPREEANLVCAILAKRTSHVKTVVRTTSMELLEAWREGEIDVDFMVSPELETAHAIVGVVGLPAARQTDAFAEGRVQVVEFDVPADASEDKLVGCPLRTAELPPDCKVASLIRGGRMVFPRGDERILPTDRVVVIASPASAHAWNDRLARERQTIDDVVIFGAGRMGTTIGGVLVGRGTRVRLVDADRERAHDAAEEMPDVRVFHASAFDSTFLERQRIGQAAKVFSMNQHCRGDGPVRARSSHPPDRDARGRPFRDPRHNGAPGLRAHGQATRRLARDQLACWRRDPRRQGHLPARLRCAAAGRSRDPVRRVGPRVGGRARPVSKAGPPVRGCAAGALASKDGRVSKARAPTWRS